jgi:FMN phosphatase YigB (HAD superfamily)
MVDQSLARVDPPARGARGCGSGAGLDAVARLPEVVQAELSADCSPELNRAAEMLRFERAGLDGELAEGLYRLDFDPEGHPVYPDVPGVLAQIRARGVRIALVSDIHFDLRADLAAHGIAHLIDAYVLSFEHGFQKPDSGCSVVGQFERSRP